MSLDNVIGVAAAAKGNMALLIFGLLVVDPAGGRRLQLILELIERFPLVIVAGGGAARLDRGRADRHRSGRGASS